MMRWNELQNPIAPASSSAGASRRWVRALGICVLVGALAFAGHGETPEGEAAVWNAETIPDKTIVLTFDDAVQSHVDYVAPMLKEYGFGATFFVCHLWMDDQENFMDWRDIAKLHGMGFEIGNHTWSHGNFHTAESAEVLEAELERVEEALARVGVPKPVSFGWPGNSFGPEALAVVRAHGFQFARRGMQPEKPYGEIHLGPLYDPKAYDPLLIPTSGDAYPNWTLEHFKRLVDQAQPGKAVIVQFHGVPDIAHPWVHTPADMFAQYMAYLKEGGFRVIALRDLAPYIDREAESDDPTVAMRHPVPK